MQHKKGCYLLKDKLSKVNAALPQTQCELCGYQGCLPYARAVVEQGESIDLCRPGGKETLNVLAGLMAEDASKFAEGVQARYKPPAVAKIDADVCIGCVKCVQACPVDAIVGSGKMMHQVVTDYCTGCGLCVAPCPVDCIYVEPIELPVKTVLGVRAKRAQQRYQRRQSRLEKSVDPVVGKTDISADVLRKRRKQEIILALSRERKRRTDLVCTSEDIDE